VSGFVAKFSWSRLAALRLAREIGVLTAFVRVPPVPLLPGAVASTQAVPADHSPAPARQPGGRARQPVV